MNMPNLYREQEKRVSLDGLIGPRLAHRLIILLVEIDKESL